MKSAVDHSEMIACAYLPQAAAPQQGGGKRIDGLTASADFSGRPPPHPRNSTAATATSALQKNGLAERRRE